MNTKLITVILSVVLFSSCSVTGKPGVIMETKRARIVLGNAKNKQIRHDAKIKKDSAILVKQ